MKQILLFLTLTVICNTQFAQNFSVNTNNYRNFYLANNPTTIWENGDYKYYSSVDIIDTIISNDTTFYIYRNDFLNITDPNDPEVIFNKYSSSIFGNKCFCLTNGDSYLINSSDTFLIITLSDIYNTWHFYNFTNNDYIEAKVTNIDTLSFLGIVDSVKYIELTKKNISGNTINNFINGNIITLSKNYGFIDFPDLRKINDSINTHTLKGYDEIDVKPLTYSEVYNFEVTDTFQYSIHYGDWEYIYYETRIIIDKYYSTYNDTLHYSLKRIKANMIPPHDIYSIDTINYSISDLDSFVTNIIPFHETNSVMTFNINNTFIAYNNRLVCKIINSNLNTDNDSLFYYDTPLKNYTFWSSNATTFINGCGVLNYHKGSGGSSCPDEIPEPLEELIYFNKAGEIWGIEKNYTINKYISNENDIILFPNPTKNKVSVSSSFKINEIEIFNSIGNKIYTNKNINKNNFIIDIERQPIGVYYVKTICNNNTVTTNKIIKQ